MSTTKLRVSTSSAATSEALAFDFDALGSSTRGTSRRFARKVYPPKAGFLLMGGVMLAYCQLAMQVGHRSGVTVVVPEMTQTPRGAPRARSEEADTWAPDFREPLGAPATAAQLAASFSRRTAVEVEDDADFELPDDIL